jgi:hypothetical protein
MQEAFNSNNKKRRERLRVEQYATQIWLAAESNMEDNLMSHNKLTKIR